MYWGKLRVKKKEERGWRKVILPFGSLQIWSIYMFYPQLRKNAILYHQWHQCMFVRVLAAIVETVCPSGDIWKLGGYCRWNKPHTHHTKSLLLVFGNRPMLFCEGETEKTVVLSAAYKHLHFTLVTVEFLCAGHDVRSWVTCSTRIAVSTWEDNGIH